MKVQDLILKMALTIAVGLAASASAHAAIVTAWDANITGLWVAFEPPGVDVSADQKRLSWGGGASQSSLTIAEPQNPVAVTTFIGGGMPPAALIADSIALTHDNFPIRVPFLRGADLGVSIELTPTSPAGPALPTQSFVYRISFDETFNTAPCAVTSPTPCNDVFVQTSGLLNSSFALDTDAGGPAPAQDYFVNIFPTTGGVLAPLDPAACAAAGEPSGCIGFTTPERQSTELAFGFTISTEPLSLIPEPGTLSLLGLGLFGFGLTMRRRQGAR